ncbi:hypothetical protein A5721_23475 [Mycobacterium vulneris]|nr:hypothetical protein A5721_23475 [Mycolicibacterium vulneris]
MTAALGSIDSAAIGQEKIDWAGRFMPVTTSIAADLKHSGLIAGLRIGLSLVLEPKTANLALCLAEAGADISVYSDAAGTRADVAAALDRAGIAVFARADGDPQTDHQLALDFLDRRNDLVVDDGAALIRLLHAERPELLESTIGASEETTSGLWPLRKMEQDNLLRLPVIAANDARCKTLFDNGYGTGESTVLTMFDLLQTGGSGLAVAIAGYGYVGRAVARAANALGAIVTVAELDAVKALEAVHAGFAVAPLVEAAATADLLISATGRTHTVTFEHLLALPDGAAVAVAGGVDQEIAIDAALTRGARRHPVADRVARIVLPNGRSVVLLDDGNCINCTAGEGNPIEIMDLSFGVQLSAIELLADHGSTLSSGVHPLPASADARLARIRLDSLGIRIDEATP